MFVSLPPFNDANIWPFLCTLMLVDDGEVRGGYSSLTLLPALGTWWESSSGELSPSAGNVMDAQPTPSLGSRHTRDWEPVTSTLQALSSVEKAETHPSSLHTALEGPTEYVNARCM